MSTSKGEKKIYRWGIIGCGKISNDFALNLLKHDQCRLTACAARDQSAQEFAKTFGIKKAYQGYQDLINDKEIDCVYVGTIHPTHKENVIKCLKAGKHVVVEKPLGMNSQEMEECIAAARENRRYLLEAVWTRFFPAVKQSRDWFNEGAIGDIVCFEGNFGIQMDVPSNVPRLWTNHLGGGALLDLGIYALHHLPLWFGEKYPERIVAAGVVDKDHNVDTITTATLLYDKNQYAVIHTNFYGNTTNEFIITGTKGEIRIHGHAPTKCELKQFGNRKDKTHRKVMHQTIKEFELPKNFSRVSSFNFGNSEGLFYEVSGIIEDLDQGLIESTKYNWREMLIAAQVSDEIRKQIGLTYKQDQRASKL